MKTFRFSLVALVATTLFVACSNDEVVEPINSETQAISFRMQGGTPEITTRALATTKSSIEAFLVYGSDYITAPPTTTKLFDGLTVARQVDAADIFDYSPKKYYSMGAESAEFFAISPVSAIAGTTSNITGLDVTDLKTEAFFDYVVPKPDDTGNIVQEDLLVAGTSIATPSATAVSLDFQHALSRIFVKAANELSDDVVIKELTLKNLCAEGTLTGTPDPNPLSDPWEWAWSLQGDTTSYKYILAPTGVAVKAGEGVTSPGVYAPTLVTSMEQGMMVLPQITTNNDDDFLEGKEFALEVVYDVANLKNQVAHIAIADGFPFKMGIQYAITIIFSGSDLIEINFVIGVANFENDPTNTYPL